MEKKTTQRIIGISVIVALIVILLPLLFSKTETTQQTITVKAPPIPDQPSTASIAEQKNPPTPATNTIDTTPADQPPVTTAEVANPSEPPPHPTLDVPLASSTAESIQQTPPIILPEQPATQSVTPTNPPVINTETSATNKTEIPAINEDETIIKKDIPLKRIQPKTAAHHWKKMGWAVQLGSFKNKNNAIRLADKLRNAGYKAFMHKVKMHSGEEQTRVYIGPEYKQASAVRLSNKLNHEMNIHGFIIKYRPLEL